MELTSVVIGGYERSFQQLIENPKSARLFNEAFMRGLGLLRDFGTGFQFWAFGKRQFEHKFDGPGYYDQLKLEHRSGFIDYDELKISYFRHNLYHADFKLTRARGHEVLTDLDRMDITEQYSRGVSLWSLDLFKLNPGRLVIRIPHDFRPEYIGKTPYGGRIIVKEF